MTTSEPPPTGGSRRMWPTPSANQFECDPAVWMARREREKAKHRNGNGFGLTLSMAVQAEAMSLPLQPEQDDQPLTLFAVDSPASPSAQPAAASPKTTPGGFGQRWRRSFADYNPATRSWRTFQGSLLAEWETYSETWPRAGMTQAGTAYQLPPSAPLTGATASGSWPTPNAAGGTGYMSGSNRDTWRPTLEGAVQMTPEGPPPQITAAEFRGKGRKAAMWPTPRSQNGEPRNHKVWRRPDGEPQNLENAIAAADPSAIGGQLNPAWVEALMGYPIGWTELDS